MANASPSDKDRRIAELEAELADKSARLEECEDTVKAIRRGEVDAFVVQHQQGERVYSLRGSENAYQSFVERMRDGAVTLSTDNTVVYTNRRFMDLLGLPHSRVAGTNLLDHVAPEDSYIAEALLQRAQQREGSGELSFVGRDGNRVPVDMFAFPVEMDGVHAICALITDLTEIHRYRYDLEQMVESRTIELNEQNDELRRLSEAKNELVSRLGIELEKPVRDMESVVGGFPSAAELSKNRKVEFSRDGLALVENSLIRLNALREDVSMLAEIESGNARLQYSTVHLRTIALDSVEDARSVASEKGIEIIANVPSEDVSFVADPRKMRQIITALLLVCAESVEVGPIRLNASVTKNLQAVYEVCSPGHTLPVEDIACILDGHVDPEVVRRLSETVPALSIWATRQMAKFMRGDLAVQRTDSGDCLSFTVPM